MENLFTNQSVQSKTNQLVRYYQIPVLLKKEDALNIILKRIESGEKSETKQKRFISVRLLTRLSAAAVVALIFTIYLYTASIRLTGEEGKNMAFRLPDNSRVILQNDSEIKYRKYFWNRNVDLLGEAYFEVEKGIGFYVHTKSGRVDVLGTRFLVSEEKGSFLVQCFEGKVNTNFSNNSHVLTTGMQIKGAGEKNEPIIERVSLAFPEIAIFRKNFSSTPLGKVADEMEAFFGVTIEISKVANRNFSGTIQTGKLENALEIVCESMQLSYIRKDKNQILIQN